MFYKEMGWDPQLGCPTRETFAASGAGECAADLAAAIYCLRKEWR